MNSSSSNYFMMSRFEHNLRDAKMNDLTKEQVNILGGSEDFYEIINQKMKNLEFDALFMEEMHKLYSWRTDFFYMLYSNSDVDLCDVDWAGILDDIPWLITEGFNHVMEQFLLWNGQQKRISLTSWFSAYVGIPVYTSLLAMDWRLVMRISVLPGKIIIMILMRRGKFLRW